MRHSVHRATSYGRAGSILAMLQQAKMRVAVRHSGGGGTSGQGEWRALGRRDRLSSNLTLFPAARGAPPLRPQAAVKVRGH